MEQNISRKLVAAVLRVVICLPQTLTLFKFLKRRYLSSQIDELNGVCKWRGQMVRASERICFFKKCLDNSVIPRDVYEKVKKLRPRYAASIGRAFIKNDIVVEQERLEHLRDKLRCAWLRVGRFLTFTDWIRFNKLVGQIGYQLRGKVRSQYSSRLEWLRSQRFGSDKLNTESVFNLTHLKLSPIQLEVLARGPQFSLPPMSVCKEEVFSEFEMYFNQLQLLLAEIPSGKEIEGTLKVKLANLALEYANVKQNRIKFPLGKEHLAAIRELRKNENIVITRPDKGGGTVLLDKSEYIGKMMMILKDKSKFECLGSCEENDHTGLNERALQAFLLRQHKAGLISNGVYDRIRPTGSVRPRMYGLPKVHKPNPIPLRPILSMVGSAQHELARWLTEVLQPVLNRYSVHVIKDSFAFCAHLREQRAPNENTFMCSFDVVSLFTNVPIDETIQICLDTLYRSDVEPPKINEGLLKKLLLKSTRDVEFSFNNQMYRQIDGVAMGSPLGPVLANIFLGYCESLIEDDMWPDMYCRFVDDTFSLFCGRSNALEFLHCLNSLHPALRFTMEEEVENRLPFMDVLVLKEKSGFSTDIYRKPTFTGTYTRWDSYCPTGQKISLIHSLTQRAKKICSSKHLANEVDRLKAIFEKNGYPAPIVERVVKRALDQESSIEKEKQVRVYIRLPWLGGASLALKKRICRTTTNAIPLCLPTCVFTSRKMFSTSKKDVLSAEDLSCVVYLFSCACGHSYVGRTTQRLGERVRQHVPAEIVHKAKMGTCASQEPRKRGRPKKSVAETSQTLRRSARLAGKQACAVSEEQIESNDVCLPIVKSDSAITRHLKRSMHCLNAVGANVSKHFKIIAKARSENHLSVLEAIYIDRWKPELCAQKEHVRNLHLF